MCPSDMGRVDMLGLLLARGLGEVVTGVLLLLDPPSLHRAKQVRRT